jgi:hypothetical protein
MARLGCNWYWGQWVIDWLKGGEMTPEQLIRGEDEVRRSQPVQPVQPPASPEAPAEPAQPTPKKRKGK